MKLYQYQSDWKRKTEPLTNVDIMQGAAFFLRQLVVGGTPTANSRFAVPCPSDSNALRNLPRQHVLTVSVQVVRYRNIVYTF